MQNCVNCARELRGEVNGFKSSLGGVLCPQWSRFWERSLSVKGLKTLRLLRSTPWLDIPFQRLDTHLNINLETELESGLYGLPRFHLELDLQSWSFLEMLR